MVSRQIAISQYDTLLKSLIENAHHQPLSASFDIDVKVNGYQYTVKIQPEHKRNLVALQALYVRYELGIVNHELITENNILLALLELIIHQGPCVSHDC